jgi:carbon starvation protein
MSVFIVLGAITLFYLLGYRGWSQVIAKKVFGLADDEPVPAHDPELRDDIDYMPVNKHVLWGHHYTSIAGAAPIIGPAVAVFWGWVPAIFWVVFGTIFIGAVHDFGALVISARKKGHTMADIAGDVVHPRVRLLFQIIIYFLIWVVLAVFAFAIGVLFNKYPATVIPVNFEIVVAVIIGWLMYKKKVKILIPSILALIGLYALIPVGLNYEASLTLEAMMGKENLIQGNPVVTWAIFLLIYAAVASVLPVWTLLQPRDFINSHQLIVGLALLIVGLCVLHPPMSAPAINPNPVGAPPLFPFIFVTIACGAISGFHGLVSSGTTSKQLDSMKDARPIGYGGMLGEGTLAAIATVAVAAGLKDWGSHYHEWNSSGINAIGNFVQGAGNFVSALGFSVDAAAAIVAVLAISFAATSMDTGARIQRLIVEEMGHALNQKWMTNRYVATVLAVGPAIPLVLAGTGAWGPLWLLFGTTNQLIGGMTFLILFVYLFRANRPVLPIAIPMIFLVLMTTGAMIVKLMEWINHYGTEAQTGNLLTIIVGAIILVLELWMIVEAILVVHRLTKERATA